MLPNCILSPASNLHLNCSSRLQTHPRSSVHIYSQPSIHHPPTPFSITRLFTVLSRTLSSLRPISSAPRIRSTSVAFRFIQITRNMATTSSNAAPIGQTESPINPKYALPALSTVPGADPSRNVLDGARVVVAQLVADAWGLDVGKVFAGVDTGKLILQALKMK